MQNLHYKWERAFVQLTLHTDSTTNQISCLQAAGNEQKDKTSEGSCLRFKLFLRLSKRKGSQTFCIFNETNVLVYRLLYFIPTFTNIWNLLLLVTKKMKKRKKIFLFNKRDI